MANFLPNLWQSIFTPGTTPTLILATNATFAMLQITLAGLLFATRSIHFVILSILCGGLWAAINWFAQELRQAQEEEARKQAEQKDGASSDSTGSGDRQESGEVADSADDEGRAAEVGPSGVKSGPATAKVQYEPSPEDEQLRSQVMDSLRKSGQATATGTGVDASVGESKQRQPRNDMSGSGYISTDSEWEKVEGDR